MLSLSMFLIGAFIWMALTSEDDDDHDGGMMVPAYQRPQ